MILVVVGVMRSGSRRRSRRDVLVASMLFGLAPTDAATIAVAMW